MSGFEIAGIVLALYPTLLDAANGLRGFQKVRRWWQFEAEFEDFIAAVETQSIAFSQTIEILVGQLDISEDERTKLENDADSSLWHQPHIQAELRRRVKSRYYPWFTRQLMDINEAMNELYQLLPIGKVYHLDSTSLESEIFRFRQSFSGRKEQLLSVIKDRTEELYQFLDRATQISRSSPALLPRSKSQASSFLSLQRQARELFECFQKNWACSCASGHPCGITVRKEASGTGRIGLLVTTNADRAQLSVEFREMQQPPRPASETSSISKQEDITSLKTQIEVKSRMKKMKEKASKGIFSLAFSSMSTVANPHSLDEGKSPLEKKASKLKKRLRFSTLPSTPRAPVSTASSTLSAVSSTSTAVVSTSTSASEPASGARRIRFAAGSGPEPSISEPDATTAAASVAAAPITNICGLLCGPRPQESLCLGFWAVNETKVLLHQERSTQGQAGPRFESVEEFLATTPRRDKRMRVGLATLLTVLSLGPSPWLPPKLHRTHLLVHNDPPPATTSSPPASALSYLQHSSLRATLKSPPDHSSAADFAKTTLLSLGILLLELVFRETLECQPAWTKFLSDGQPNEATALCTALQWQKRVEEEFGFGLAEAVRRCVLCMFDAPLDLGSAAFVQAVWAGVVRPLEDFLQGWDR